MAIKVITLAAGTDQFCSIYYAIDKDNFERVKAFMKFPIPSELFGVTPTAAVLSVYATSYASGVNATAFEMKATFASWDGSSNVAAMHGLSLDNYDTFETKTIAKDAWTEFDVLGSADVLARSVKQACVDSEPHITLVLTHSATTPDVREELLNIGGNGPSTGEDRRVLSFPGNEVDGTHLPYLTIAYPSSARPPVHSGIGGGALLF